jgi:hypothetical protein
MRRPRLQGPYMHRPYASIAFLHRGRRRSPAPALRSAPRVSVVASSEQTWGMIALNKRVAA